MNATRKQLEAQFQAVVRQGWLAWFQREARRAGTTTSHLLGMGSRETNLKNIKGDYRNGRYNGFGVMQVDIGTDPVYARTWTPDKVEPSIVRGVDIYLSKVVDTKWSVGKKVLARNRSFVGRMPEADDLRRIATAAYNCGRWAHYHFSRGTHMDSTTAGGDYSRDVYDRAVEFAEMLEHGGYEPNAIAAELTLQGKYARQSHRDRFRIVTNPRVNLPLDEPQEAAEMLEAADYGRDETAIDILDLTDDEINNAVEGIGSPPTAQTDPAGSKPFSKPTEYAVAPGAGEVPGHGQEAPPPLGDPPDAKPKHWFDVEDWKPWAIRWVTRIWKAVSGITLPSGGGFSFAAISGAGGEYWWLWLVAAAVCVIIPVSLGILATIIIVCIWLWQNRRIPDLKVEQYKALVDLNKPNVGLQFKDK